MSQETIEILDGKESKNHLKLQELEHLVDAWMDETYHPIELPQHETHRFVEKVLWGTPIGDYIASVRLKKLQREDRVAQKEGLMDHLQDALNSRRMVIARMNGRAVGMVRVMKLHRVTGSKVVHGDVFEIGKGMTLPEVGGRGIYRQMHDLIVGQLRTWYSDAAILAGTKNETIKAMRRKDGWQEIGFEEYLRIHGAKEEYIASRRDDIQQKGWTAFLYMPQSKLTSFPESPPVPRPTSR